jgi:hypothetical protein
MSNDKPKPAVSKLDTQKDPKQVTEEEWRKVLTTEQFDITRKSGTYVRCGIGYFYIT